VYVHEFLYPIFQAYDSVTMDVDMEIGGSDQMFNMLAGRTLMRKLKGKGKEKFVLTTKLLTDPSGRKMGKTEGNMVNLDDPAEAMYGKLMAIPDSLILPYFELCTDTPARELTAYGLQLTAKSINPRDLKMRLAREVVTLYHSAKAATTAEAHFVNVFQKHQVPDSVEEVRVARWPATLDQLVYVSGASASASAARRLIEAGGIKIDGETVRNPKQSIPPSKSGRLLQRGKRYFRRVRLA
jgi:tyrosyl-tRNA synthetase